MYPLMVPFAESRPELEHWGVQIVPIMTRHPLPLQSPDSRMVILPSGSKLSKSLTRVWEPSRVGSVLANLSTVFTLGDDRDRSRLAINWSAPAVRLENN